MVIFFAWRGEWNSTKAFVLFFSFQFLSDKDDVWIVPVKEGIEYVSKHSEKKNSDLINEGKGSVFGCDKFNSPPYSSSNCEPLAPCRYAVGRVSFKTSFDSKQPKLEPKLVSALSETKRLFGLFCFYTETESFDVSRNQNKQKTNRNSLIGSIFW